jgi:hypothetical protein
VIRRIGRAQASSPLHAGDATKLLAAAAAHLDHSTLARQRVTLSPKKSGTCSRSTQQLIVLDTNANANLHLAR